MITEELEIRYYATRQPPRYFLSALSRCYNDRAIAFFAHDVSEWQQGEWTVDGVPAGGYSIYSLDKLRHATKGEVIVRTEQVCAGESAFPDYTEAIRLGSKLASAYSNRGVAYKQKGELDKANKDFAMAKELGYKP